MNIEYPVSNDEIIMTIQILLNFLQHHVCLANTQNNLEDVIVELAQILANRDRYVAAGETV